MFKTFTPVVAGLSLLLVPPAIAEEPRAFVKDPTDVTINRTVVLKGMLRYVKGSLGNDPRALFAYWELHTADKTYYLDLRGKELLERAEQLIDRPVVVAGFPEPTSPTLLVTSLQADEFVKATIHVEVRGRLVGIPLAQLLDLTPESAVPLQFRAWPGQDHLPGIKPRPVPVAGWCIFLGGQPYQLDLGDRQALLELAKELDGKGVIVTGTRDGEVIHVIGMKADDGSYRETIAVEIQGQLHRPRADVLEPGRLRSFFTVTAAGKSYELDLGGNRALQKLAASLENMAVVVTGTIRDGEVSVTGLRSSDPRDKTHLAEATTSIAGVWDSNWGPATIECADVEDYGSVPITGSWKQGPGQVGVIKSGTFDSAKGVLEFAFDEPWHNQSGTAVLSLSADGKTLKGTWRFTTSGGGGNWTMTRR